MKYALAVLMFAVICGLAGCMDRPALSVRPLYKTDEKPVAEPRLEGEWTPVNLGDFGLREEKSIHWTVTAESDGCYQAEYRKKDEKKPDHEWNEFYRVCLVSLDNKLFFDQQLDKKSVEQNMISAEDLAPELAPLHMTGRLWPHQDLIRVKHLKGEWVGHSQPEELQFDVNKFTLFTGSTAQLRQIMTQHSEDPEAMDTAWYLCRPDVDCSVRVADAELALRPNDTEVISGAALIYAGTGDYDKAIALLNGSSELVPAQARAGIRGLVGLVRMRKRDFAGARSEWAAAEKLNTDPQEQGDDALWIGITYFLEGKYGDAHTVFAKLKDPRDSYAAAMRIVLEYASLFRMGRRKQAESFLAGKMASFVGDRDDQLFLLGAAGRINGFSPEHFSDDDLQAGQGVLYALVRLAKDDPKDARVALERSLKTAVKWSPVSLGAEIELERLNAMPAASK